MATIQETITLGKQIQDKLALYIAVSAANSNSGVDRYYKDISAVYSLVKALEFIVDFGDDFTFLDIENLVSRVNEYYFVTELDDPRYVVSAVEEAEQSVIQSTNEWNTFTIGVSYNGQTVFTGMPFDVDDIDVDTIFLVVNGDTVPYNLSISADGFHMVDNTLFWHYFYELTTTDVVVLKWRD